MTDEQPRFTVLVSVDGGITWQRHAGIIGNTAEQAIERVRKAGPSMAEHVESAEGIDPEPWENAQYWASKSFRPRRMEKQLVEKWGLHFVDELPPAGESPVKGSS